MIRSICVIVSPPHCRSTGLQPTPTQLAAAAKQITPLNTNDQASRPPTHASPEQKRNNGTSPSHDIAVVCRRSPSFLQRADLQLQHPQPTDTSHAHNAQSNKYNSARTACRLRRLTDRSLQHTRCHHTHAYTWSTPPADLCLQDEPAGHFTYNQLTDISCSPPTDQHKNKYPLIR